MDIVERLQKAIYHDNHGNLPADAADEIKRLRAGPPAWVACSDRMPDNGQNVAFVVKSGSQFYGGLVLGGRYNAVVGFTVPGAAFVASHWMPLPEPPVECRERGEE